MPSILIIEDEPAIVDAISYALETGGMQAFVAETGLEGLKKIEKNHFDLVVLDVGLPDDNGFEILKKIRKISQVPVIFLTARSEEIDRIVGLEIGADDYVIKPFSPRELVARLRAVLRRSTSSSSRTDALKKVPDTNFSNSVFWADTDRKIIHYRGKPLVLSRYEYLLLLILIEKPGRIFSRDQLMEKVWDDPASSLDRTIDAHIKNIRSKLREIDPEADPIVTHRGFGYSLREDV